MKEPLVSICIPVYNCEKYISQTIKSALEQSYRNFEIIIVDDLSTDGSEDIVKSFNDSRIYYYKNEKNLGMVNNWNQALSHANGKYIKLLCQDDILFKNCIEEQVLIMESNPEVMLVSCASNIIDENNRILLTRRNFKKDCNINGSSVAKKSLISGKNHFGEPAVVLYRREILDKIGHYDNSFWYLPDWDFSLRVLDEGNFYYVNKVLCCFRISKGAQTTEILKRNREVLKMEDERFLRKHNSVGSIHLNRLQMYIHEINMKKRNILKVIFLRYYL